MKRAIAWFSCGAASAVAAKLAIEKYGDECVVVNCDTRNNEHPDNYRFMEDIESWLGKPIQTIASEEFTSVDDVVVKTRYMAGPHGARCTAELKKRPRWKFEKPDDIHIFGMHAGEEKRAIDFAERNFELKLDFLLIDKKYTKEMCHALLDLEGIRQPTMYSLGYKNNNCIGCLKATSIAYWARIRRDFPDVFNKRVQQSRELNVRLTRLRGERIFIDEIPVDYPLVEISEDLSCGPYCGEIK